jgi:bifunctional DNA-binding transcriptional regulator/antitoxin component of YhaV-PrlF toxin-antitoxin module
MSETLTLRLTQRGVLVLPKELREAYNLMPGDFLTLIDLGGIFLLSPRPSQVDVMADRIRQSLGDQGETLESMLRAIREERLNYNENDQGLP